MAVGLVVDYSMHVAHSFGIQDPKLPRTERAVRSSNWSAANGGLREGGLSKSEDIRKRAFFIRFLDSQVLCAPSGPSYERC